MFPPHLQIIAKTSLSRAYLTEPFACRTVNMSYGPITKESARVWWQTSDLEEWPRRLMSPLLMTARHRYCKHNKWTGHSQMAILAPRKGK